MSKKSSPNGPDIVYFEDEESSKKVVGEAILNLWDAVNNLTRLRPKRRTRYRVTIFGSARARPGSSAYEETRRLAKKLARMDCDIVTGGGPGLMQAANEGALAARQGRGHSIGIRVDVGSEQATNPFVGQVYQHRTFFSRLHHFVLLSEAFIVVTGGIGTTLEMFMIWQLLQVRKIYGTPLILVGPMWRDVVKWAQTHMLDGDSPRANPVDMTIPQCVNTVEEALAIVKKHRAAWARGAKTRRAGSK